MYSGTTFRNHSGNFIGVHQKVDRAARRVLRTLAPQAVFPTSKMILHFEGVNGPDGVKRKSPGQDEPWHYYQPDSSEPQQILDIIQNHYNNLVEQIKDQNHEKIAFEASWLAHALVDGLTPAHHYPFEEELEKMRGEGIETRNTLREKLVIKGDTKRQMFKNNWKMWGAKGLMTTHGAFEWGVAAIITPVRLSTRSLPSDHELAEALQKGIVGVFEQAAQDIYELDMYKRFYRLGWTKKLARQVREDLMPTITKVVVLSWWLAWTQAGAPVGEKHES